LGHREQARQLLLVPQPILQRQHCSRRSNQGRQQFGEPFIRRALKPNEHQLRNTDFPRALGASRPDLEIACRAVDKDALAPHGLVVRAQQEMDLVPGASQFGTIIASDRPTPNDCNLHMKTESGTN
jgi:hypothetical protein